MARHTPRTSPLFHTLAGAVLAVGLNASLLGALATQPTHGEMLLVAQNPTAMPLMVGTLSFSAFKAAFLASFGHAARDIRHAERNLLRSIHHGARDVAAMVSSSGAPADAAPTC
jgi:hypothetical protein